MRITREILNRHGGTVLCRGCGQPIEEGEKAVRRRVSSKVRYFHPGCVYSEAKISK